jgi:hypothetical protein
MLPKPMSIKAQVAGSGTALLVGGSGGSQPSSIDVENFRL